MTPDFQRGVEAALRLVRAKRAATVAEQAEHEKGQRWSEAHRQLRAAEHLSEVEEEMISALLAAPTPPPVADPGAVERLRRAVYGWRSGGPKEPIAPADVRALLAAHDALATKGAPAPVADPGAVSEGDTLTAQPALDAMRAVFVREYIVSPKSPHPYDDDGFDDVLREAIAAGRTAVRAEATPPVDLYSDVDRLAKAGSDACDDSERAAGGTVRPDQRWEALSETSRRRCRAFAAGVVQAMGDRSPPAPVALTDEDADALGKMLHDAWHGDTDAGDDGYAERDREPTRWRRAALKLYRLGQRRAPPDLAALREAVEAYRAPWTGPSMERLARADRHRQRIVEAALALVDATPAEPVAATFCAHGFRVGGSHCDGCGTTAKPQEPAEPVRARCARCGWLDCACVLTGQATSDEEGGRHG